MTEESKIALRANKVARIIISLCDMYNVSLKDATDIYYKSTTADLIEEGISDLQCRSDKYLATLVWEEFQESNIKNNVNDPS